MARHAETVSSESCGHPSGAARKGSYANAGSYGRARGAIREIFACPAAQEGRFSRLPPVASIPLLMRDHSGG